MPTYQYACTECGHAFDQVQSFSEDSLTDCPECRGRLRKLFNAVGVVFKGSGFYRNDSRSASSSEAGEKSPTDEKSTEKSEKKSENTSGTSATKADSGSSSTSTSTTPSSTPSAAAS